MRKRTLWLGLSFLLVAALVLTGCPAPVVEPVEPVVPVVPVEPVEPVVEEPVVEEPVVVPGVLQYGGTLTPISMTPTVDPTYWDPMRGGAQWNLVPYLSRLMAGDVSRGQTGTKEHTFGGRFIPDTMLRNVLLESWEILQSPLRLIFHLRPEIYWTAVPGIMARREFTADDVVYSLERAFLCPTHGAIARPLRFEWVKSITALDDHTVVIEGHYIHGDWEFEFAWGWNGVMYPEELVDAGVDDWRNHVGIGNGPFFLTDFVSGSFISYERNPNYWEKTIIDGKEYSVPFVDKLVYPIIPEEAVQLAALRTARADIWEKAAWVYKETLAATNPELLMWEVQSHDYGELYYRTDIEPFDDLRILKATSLAIDRQALIDGPMGGYGILWNAVSPQAWGPSLHTPMADLPAATQEFYTYDPVTATYSPDLVAAKQLLTDAGYPDGFKVDCMVMNIPIHLDSMVMIKEDLAKIGIDVTLKVVTSTIWWADMRAELHPAMGFTYESSPTPYTTFEAMYIEPGKCHNWAARFIPALDELHATYHDELDTVKQAKILKDVNDILLNDLSRIFLPGPNNLRYAWPWVRNYEGETTSDYSAHALSLYNIIWIDQAMKADMGY